VATLATPRGAQSPFLCSTHVSPSPTFPHPLSPASWSSLVRHCKLRPGKPRKAGIGRVALVGVTPQHGQRRRFPEAIALPSAPRVSLGRRSVRPAHTVHVREAVAHTCLLRLDVEASGAEPPPPVQDHRLPGFLGLNAVADRAGVAGVLALVAGVAPEGDHAHRMQRRPPIPGIHGGLA